MKLSADKYPFKSAAANSNVNVFFAGTQEQFNQISYDRSDNTALATANVVCNYPVPTIS